MEEIVKMSEVFEISLDEFIKGDLSVKKRANVDQDDFMTKKDFDSKTLSRENSISSTQRITGIILLCMAFLVVLFFTVMGGLLGGIIFASPFLVCGIICLICKKNAGLWCAWAIYVLLTAYLIWATGITWSVIFLTLHWEPSMNYMRLATAWALFIYLLVLVLMTVKRYSKDCFTSVKDGIAKTSICWIIYGVVKFAYKIIYDSLLNSIIVDGQIIGDYGLLTLCNVIFDSLKLPLFTISLVYTVRLLKTVKVSKQVNK